MAPPTTHPPTRPPNGHNHTGSMVWKLPSCNGNATHRGLEVAAVQWECTRAGLEVTIVQLQCTPYTTNLWWLQKDSRKFGTPTINDPNFWWLQNDRWKFACFFVIHTFLLEQKYF